MSLNQETPRIRCSCSSKWSALNSGWAEWSWDSFCSGRGRWPESAGSSLHWRWRPGVWLACGRRISKSCFWLGPFRSLYTNPARKHPTLHLPSRPSRTRGPFMPVWTRCLWRAWLNWGCSPRLALERSHRTNSRSDSTSSRARTCTWAPTPCR